MLGAHLQPLLCLLLALQAKHDGLPSYRSDLQLVLFSLQLLLFVDHAAAQQTHIQQGCLILGALIALREAEITLTQFSVLICILIIFIIKSIIFFQSCTVCIENICL